MILVGRNSIYLGEEISRHPRDSKGGPEEMNCKLYHSYYLFCDSAPNSELLER